MTYLTSLPGRIKRLPRRILLWIIIPAALVLVMRAALPLVLCHAINSRLAKIEGYSSRVEDVNIRLFRGAYQLKGVSVQQREGSRLEPFLTMETIDFSLAWRELFDGRIVSDIVLVKPELRLAAGATPDDVGGDGRRWQDAIEDIFPIEITLFEIRKGLVRFVDEHSTPRVDVTLRDLELVATGLRNRPIHPGISPARLHAEAATTGDGRLSVMIDGDPLAENTSFNVELDWKDVQLPALNDFLKAYAGVDVSAGTLQIYAEASARDGELSGYIKPFFENVVFENAGDQNKPFFRRIWESLVSGIASIVKNDDEGHVATRIPFSMSLGETDVGIWTTIRTLVRHGFIEALKEGRESEVSSDNIKDGK